MKLSIKITDEVLTHPGQQYSAKKEVTVVEVENMDADPAIVAATLKGAAEKIWPPKIYANGGITSGTISASHITAYNG